MERRYKRGWIQQLKPSYKVILLIPALFIFFLNSEFLQPRQVSWGGGGGEAGDSCLFFGLCAQNCIFFYPTIGAGVHKLRISTQILSKFCPNLFEVCPNIVWICQNIAQIRYIIGNFFFFFFFGHSVPFPPPVSYAYDLQGHKVLNITMFHCTLFNEDWGGITIMPYNGNSKYTIYEICHMK